MKGDMYLTGNKSMKLNAKIGENIYSIIIIIII
jgi:hypothetical protein